MSRSTMKGFFQLGLEQLMYGCSVTDLPAVRPSVHLWITAQVHMESNVMVTS